MRNAAPSVSPGVNVVALETALRHQVDGEVRFDPGSRGAYATDASNYRQVPIGVVIPRSVEAAVRAVAICREHDAPVLSRGGGTSLGGGHRLDHDSATTCVTCTACSRSSGSTIRRCTATSVRVACMDTAKRVLRRTANILRPWLAVGTLVVGLEPSCTAVFRSDAGELLPEDIDLHRLRDRYVTLAEAVLHHSPERWRPRELDRRAIVQKHCHRHAIMGQTDVQAMSRAGVEATVLDAGCCGLVGNFGFERGHYDISMACAEQALLPAVREAPPGTLVVADGFSCRTQIEQAGTGRRAMHLAELLTLDESSDEAAAAPRPAPARAAGRLVSVTTAGSLLATAVWGAVRLWHTVARRTR